MTIKISDPVDFYIDYLTKEIKLKSDTDETTIALSTRVEHLLSAITTPDGDTLDKRTNIAVQVEFFYSIDSKWHNPGDFLFISAGVVFGLKSGLFDNGSIYTQSSVTGLFTTGVACGSSSVGNVSSEVARPCRIHITAN